MSVTIRINPLGPGVEFQEVVFDQLPGALQYINNARSRGYFLFEGVGKLTAVPFSAVAEINITSNDNGV